jgi:hypothetical protein
VQFSPAETERPHQNHSRYSNNNAARLKDILDSFARATGLVINFHKSTLVPLHADDDTVALVRDALGCALETFP